MKRIVLASHGELANGMKDSVKILVGDVPNVYSICAYTNGIDDVEEQIDALFSSFDNDDEIIVITDVFGGSVNTAFMKKLDSYKFWLISGMSLGLVIQMIIGPENNTEESITSDIDSAKNNIIFCNGYLNK